MFVMVVMMVLMLYDMIGGCFVLGFGVSGLQVVEGLYGVFFKMLFMCLCEFVEICCMVFSGEKVNYQGKVFQFLLFDSEGKVI